MEQQTKDGMMSDKTSPITDPRKCKMHNMWMRKGQCEICRLEADKRQAQLNAERGIEPKKIIIKKL